jgi:hypothetical protein
MLYLTLALAVVLPVVLAAGALLLNRVPLLDPPGVGARLRAYLTSNVAETRPEHPFAELRERSFDIPAEGLYARALEAVRALGWRVVEQDPRGLRLDAIVQTPLLRFRDDVRIEVHPNGARASRLYVRSASRVGRGDFGANTRHVLDLYRAAEAAREAR